MGKAATVGKINIILFLSCSIKGAFSRSSINLEGHSLMTSPAVTSKQQHAPLIVVNDATPATSTENSPVLPRSRSTSPLDLRKQVLITQSTQHPLKKNPSAKSLIVLSNQVYKSIICAGVRPGVVLSMSKVESTNPCILVSFYKNNIFNFFVYMIVFVLIYVMRPILYSERLSITNLL